jgi:hypothetical protein
LSGDLLGIKWKPIRTTEGFKKRDPNDPQELTRALHIEGPADRAHKLCTKLSQWYSSASNNFPDGTKIRLIPPFSTILSTDNKQKFATLVTRQDTLNKRLAQTTTREFATNLLLDKKDPVSDKSLRQLLMEIPSSAYPGTSCRFS